MLAWNLKFLTNILCSCEEQGCREEAGQRTNRKLRVLVLTHPVGRAFRKTNLHYILKTPALVVQCLPHWSLLAPSCLPGALPPHTAFNGVQMAGLPVRGHPCPPNNLYSLLTHGYCAFVLQSRRDSHQQNHQREKTHALAQHSGRERGHPCPASPISSSILRGHATPYQKHKMRADVKFVMDLENIMLSEISQTEKEIYCMISLICGI